MYLNEEEIRRMEERYGTPAVERMSFEMGEREWSILRGSQVGGRAHDVTLFSFRGNSLAVIAKHSYPPGLYRAPSGGVLPGESMEEGIAREMREETGLEVRLKRYLLRVHVDFTHGEERVAWTTHIFTAEAVSEEIQPQDRKEIREARWVDVDELAGRVRQGLLSSGSVGLKYRALLHDRVMEALRKEE